MSVCHSGLPPQPYCSTLFADSVHPFGSFASAVALRPLALLEDAVLFFGFVSFNLIAFCHVSEYLGVFVPVSGAAPFAYYAAVIKSAGHVALSLSGPLFPYTWRQYFLCFEDAFCTALAVFRELHCSQPVPAIP